MKRREKYYKVLILLGFEESQPISTWLQKSVLRSQFKEPLFVNELYHLIKISRSSVSKSPIINERKLEKKKKNGSVRKGEKKKKKEKKKKRKREEKKTKEKRKEKEKRKKT